MKKQIQLPMIAVRGCVLYPNTTSSLYVGRKHSIATLKEAIQNHQGYVLVFTQKDSLRIAPTLKKDFYLTGTVCIIESHLELADETMKIQLRAVQRVRLLKVQPRLKTPPQSLVRFGSAMPLPAEKKSVTLHSDEKRSTLGLLLRWNPDIALTDETDQWDALKKEKNLGRFVDQLLGATFCPSIRRVESIREMAQRRLRVGTLEMASKKKLQRMNHLIKLRHEILKQSSKLKQIKMLRKMLIREITEG